MKGKVTFGLNDCSRIWTYCFAGNTYPDKDCKHACLLKYLKSKQCLICVGYVIGTTSFGRDSLNATDALPNAKPFSCSSVG